MSKIIQWDVDVFRLINQDMAHAWLDVFMPFVRNMYVWAPLYIFLIVWFTWHFGRNGWLVIALVFVTFALTDGLSSHLIKPFIGRLRPCQEPALAEHIRLLVHCGSGKSFTSSHAANHFGLAMFVGLVLRPFFKPALVAFLLWAGTISLAQVYVGVHYPIDISGGALLGVGVGWSIFMIYKRFIKLEK